MSQVTTSTASTDELERNHSSPDLWRRRCVGSGASDVFVVGTFGQIVHYNGTSWSKMTSGRPNLSSCVGSGPSDVFALGGGSVYTVVSSYTTTGLAGADDFGPDQGAQ